MIYFGKISELAKTLKSVKEKEPRLSQYISLMLKRIQYLELKPIPPKTYKGGFINSSILPDGVEGNFAFNSDNISLAITYSTILMDFVTNNDAKFVVESHMNVYFRHDNGTFEDSGKAVLTGYVYSNELGSPKAKYISSKARSAIVKIVKLKPDAIEGFLKRLPR